MDHASETHSSSVEHLRRDIINHLQIASSFDSDRRLLSADDALQSGIPDDYYENEDDDEMITLQGRIKIHSSRKASTKRLDGSKLTVPSDRTIVMLEAIKRHLSLKEVSQRISTLEHSRCFCAMTRDKSTSFAIKMFTNAKRSQCTTWARREFELLSRLCNAKVNTPEPVLCLGHILVTRLVGKIDQPALALADINPMRRYTQERCFIYALASIRRLYQVTRVVLGNVSEHTLLFDGHKCWLADLSGAVSREHADHMEVLVQTLVRLQAFFRSRGLPEAARDTIGLLPDDVALAFITKEDVSQDFEDYRECRLHLRI